MPIYEYACDDCGTRFEKLVRNTAASVACPKCGQDHLTTQYSTFAARNGSSTASAQSAGGCGAEACGSGACGSGMCGMNFN